MGKKKKNKEKVAKVKDKSRIDERVKKINSMQPPDQNPWKQDNESTIDRFMRYGMRKRGEDLSIRNEMRKKKKERRYI